MKLLIPLLLVALGIILIVLGGYDDSPGGQLIGLLIAVFGVVRLWRASTRKI